jgi:hypothetical protein
MTWTFTSKWQAVCGGNRWQFSKDNSRGNYVYSYWKNIDKVITGTWEVFLLSLGL